MSNDRSKGVVGIFVLIAFLFLIFLGFAAFTISTLSKNGGDITAMTTEGEGQIAVVEVDGVIMTSRSTVQKLLIAEKDKSYKAILVRVNSPGGAVGPTQEIYEEMRRIDQDKPVYASFGTVAASGGYYIGAAAREIYANPGALTGSIGVIMNFYDLSKLYDFAKVEPQLVKAGKYKDIGSSARSMTPEERDLLEEMTFNVHEQFIQDIFSVRGDRIKDGLEGLREYAQGQIFSGAGAKERGLVDGLAGLYQTGRIIHEKLGLEGEFGLSFIKLKKDIGLSDILSGLEQSVQDISFSLKNNRIPLLLYNK